MERTLYRPLALALTVAGSLYHTLIVSLARSRTMALTLTLIVAKNPDPTLIVSLTLDLARSGSDELMQGGG
jgi:hypothetical protein